MKATKHHDELEHYKLPSNVELRQATERRAEYDDQGPHGEEGGSHVDQGNVRRCGSERLERVNKKPTLIKLSLLKTLYHLYVTYHTTIYTSPITLSFNFHLLSSYLIVGYRPSSYLIIPCHTDHHATILLRCQFWIKKYLKLDLMSGTWLEAG